MNKIAAQFSESALFQGLDSQSIEKILSKAIEKTYLSNQLLIKKGEFPEYLFLICNGKVGIYNEALLLSELGPLSVLGEGFLIDSVATATIKAHTKVNAVLIPQAHFIESALLFPQLILNIFRITKQRLQNSNNRLLSAAQSREESLKKQVEARTSELNNTLEELKETQKFRDQFMANMSHEIRTPMNAIIGLTNLLVKTSLDETQYKYLNVIKKSGENLLVIINDILDLAKIEAGKMELEKVAFHLPSTIDNISTILDIKAKEKGIELITAINNIPDYVFGDETRLTQILINLTGNAIKFTEEGKVNIIINGENNSNSHAQILFKIKDTGIGIEKKNLNKIFESFSQASGDTARKFGGTGLGLNISRQLVEMHQSKLEVESEFGSGSEFYFRIKYKIADAPETKSSEELTKVRKLDGKVFLLVEDNPFNQMVAEDTIKALFPEVEVDIAEDGFKALEKAKEKQYDFIFMDIQLPGIDGYEVTRKIRAGTTSNIKTPICALTANVTEASIKASYESGMNDYMLKPFDPNDLHEKILKYTK